MKNKRFWKFTIFTLLIIVAISISFPFIYKTFQDQKLNNKNNQIRQNQDFVWWDSEYSYLRQIEVVNNQKFSSIKTNNLLKLDLADINIDNFKLVYFDLDGNYQNIDYYIDKSKADNLSIYFYPFADIYAESNDSYYYIYFNTTRSAESDSDNGVMFDIRKLFEGEYSINIYDERKINIELAELKKWYLKEYTDENYNGMIDLQVQLDTTEDIQAKDIIIYLDENTFFPGQYIENDIVYAQIDIKNINPGSYDVYAKIDNTEFRTNSRNITVSYPLYMTWTMDWEGYDVSEANLKKMDELANKYKMPLTTYFNPRLFVASDVSEARKKRLVDWALQGVQSRNDEIALHLHMHIDMISQTGVTPLQEPKWGGRQNGHDVLTTAYGYDDFKKIVSWSLNMFEKYNLPKPVSYRAGGWFLDLENLQVLQDLGFRIDSSGREPIIYGANKIKNPWNLTSTTRPYKPNIKDQNSAEPPTMNIWEFPNNGMDSTNLPGDIMIVKFKDNYNGKPLDQYQVVTYISHPHWLLTYDAPRLIALFEEVEQHKFSNDSGPVVYTTLIGALNHIEN
jgi:hypothetical protein